MVAKNVNKPKRRTKYGQGIKVMHQYRYVYMPNHPKVKKDGYVREVFLIIEKVLGKSFPEKAVVHHVNGKRIQNSNSNLVLCEDKRYHELLHVRTRAYKACGHASWRKCWVCKEYDDPANLYIYKNNIRHRECYNNIRRKKGGRGAYKSKYNNKPMPGLPTTL